MEHEEVASAAARGATWLSAERWVNQAIAALVFVALGRLLAPAAFGLVAAANVVVLLVRMVVDAGLGRVLVQLPSLDDEDVDTAFWTSMVLGAGLAVVTAAASPLVARLFGEPHLQGVVLALSPVFVLAALDSTQSALVDRALRFRVQAIRRTAATATSAGVALGLAATGGGVWALVAQTLVYEALLVALLWTLTDWRPSLRWSRQRATGLLSLGAGLTGIRFTLYLTTNVDNLLIGVVLGPAALGLYAVAYRVFFVLYEMTGLSVARVSVPVFARCQPDAGRLQRAFLDATELGLLATLPLYIALGVLGDRMVPLLFGAKWHAAGTTTQMLALAGVAYVPTLLLQNVVTTANRVGAELRWSVLSTGLLLAAFGASVRFGVAWVALSLGLTATVLLPVRLRWVVRQRLLPADTAGRFYAQLLRLAGPAAVMAGGMGVARWQLHAEPHATVVVLCGLVGSVAYATAVRAFAPRSWRLAMAAVRHVTGRPAPAIAPEVA